MSLIFQTIYYLERDLRTASRRKAEKRIKYTHWPTRLKNKALFPHSVLGRHLLLVYSFSPPFSPILHPLEFSFHFHLSSIRDLSGGQVLVWWVNPQHICPLPVFTTFALGCKVCWVVCGGREFWKTHRRKNKICLGEFHLLSVLKRGNGPACSFLVRVLTKDQSVGGRVLQ